MPIKPTVKELIDNLDLDKGYIYNIDLSEIENIQEVNKDLTIKELCKLIMAKTYVVENVGLVRKSQGANPDGKRIFGDRVGSGF